MFVCERALEKCKTLLKKIKTWCYKYGVTNNVAL